MATFITKNYEKKFQYFFLKHLFLVCMKPSCVRQNMGTKQSTDMYRNWQKKPTNLQTENYQNVNIVFNTQIFGAHEAAPCEPKLGHLNGPKKQLWIWIETDQNWRKSKETDRQKQTKCFKKW